MWRQYNMYILNQIMKIKLWECTCYIAFTYPCRWDSTKLWKLNYENVHVILPSHIHVGGLMKEVIQQNYENNSNETKLNFTWFRLNSMNLYELNLIQFNQIQFNWNFNKNMNHANPKEKNIVFNLIHFSLEIWIQFNMNFIQCIWIQFKFFNSNSIEVHSIKVVLWKFIQY